MEWDTPFDRALGERAAKARERKAANVLEAEESISPESEPKHAETIIVMPNPQKG